MKFLTVFILSVVLLSCNKEPRFSVDSIFDETESLKGKEAYLQSPYVTAGNRLYSVGHQDGSFPPLGWHVKDEMGGVWNHPVKLLDGFTASWVENGDTVNLNRAETFVNYPFANRHYYPSSESIRAQRWQFVPDDRQGMFVQYILENESDTSRKLEFLFTIHSDLRPTWLGERTGMIDTDDLVQPGHEEGPVLIKDSENPWFVLAGSDTRLRHSDTLQNTLPGKGKTAILTYQLDMEPRESKKINFFIAGSYLNEQEARKTYDDIRKNWFRHLKSKRDRYESLAERSRLTIPDKDIEEAFRWLKYNSDWLVQSVPEIGTGITAGIPDYPWWFGVDSEYALKGYMMIGQDDPVYKTIALLDSISNAVNGNGKIVHEVSTNGAVFNEGNINETPQFASLIWEIYKWNGDREFLEAYYPTVKSGLEWLMTETDLDGNLFPDGFGMMEIHGLDSEMIDVASYTQKAFADASEMAKVMNDSLLSAEYHEKAVKLGALINEKFWSEKFESYADFIGKDSQALKLIEDAIVRADTLDKPWAVEELKATKNFIEENPQEGSRPFVVHHNWVVNTPMEVGLADSAKAIKGLNTARRYTNPFGVFVTGIDRDESSENDDGSFAGSKVFSYTGAVMTLPTGVQAIAENNYGRPDEALDYLKRMTRSFSYALPGSLYEVSPDYGMIAQAWNIYGYAKPLIGQFFGVDPMASEKRVRISPMFPSSWPDATLENIRISDNTLNIHMERDDKWETLIISQELPWNIDIENDNISSSAEVLEGDVRIKSSGDGVTLLSSKSELIKIRYQRKNKQSSSAAENNL
ncbi:glycogen debranching protein [Robertkochia aurantiaca]|uniref:glycogen debranching protein n=1 Tax=Robertkochia aurantiaca TaxID=2873700 RepID=UPI001CC928D4|nr:glycogen debranching protein [Robertkochia sp. 3YJGBD-33]